MASTAFLQLVQHMDVLLVLPLFLLRGRRQVVVAGAAKSLLLSWSAISPRPSSLGLSFAYQVVIGELRNVTWFNAQVFERFGVTIDYLVHELPLNLISGQRVPP